MYMKKVEYRARDVHSAQKSYEKNANTTGFRIKKKTTTNKIIHVQEKKKH
jgi:hypothetical protein